MDDEPVCDCGDEPPDPCEDNETCCNGTTCVANSTFQTDSNNCGGCNNVCPEGQTCVAGSCTGGGGGGGCCITYGIITTAYAYTEADLSARTVAVITAAAPDSGNCTAGTPGDPGGWSVLDPGGCPCYGCGFSTWEYAGGGIWNMLSDCSGSPSTPGLVCETSLDAGYFFSSPYEGLRVSLQCNCGACNNVFLICEGFFVNEPGWQPPPPPYAWILNPNVPGNNSCNAGCICPTIGAPCNNYGDGQEEPCGPIGDYNPASQLAFKEEPCSQEECETQVSSWMAEPSGEPNEEGLYKVKWILLDGCPGACCSDQPTQPEFVKTSIIVDAPCKCSCA